VEYTRGSAIKLAVMAAAARGARLPPQHARDAKAAGSAIAGRGLWNGGKNQCYKNVALHVLAY
jgi:hypothetical protein